MSELRITTARRTLLVAISQGAIHRHRFYPYDFYWGRRTVSARTHELIDAQLAAVDWNTKNEYGDGDTPVILTDAGRALVGGAT